LIGNSVESIVGALITHVIIIGNRRRKRWPGITAASKTDVDNRVAQTAGA